VTGAAENQQRTSTTNSYGRVVDLVIASLAERPDFADALWSFDGLWPTFMQQDPIADLFYARASTTYADYTLLAFEAREPSRPVARSCSVPFAMGDELGRPTLPEDGWDGVIRWAWLDELAGREPTHLSALEVAIRPDLRGTGLASVMLEAKRQNGCHALRHFYASTLLDSGESILALSEYLGHADPGFTLRTYPHLMPSSTERTKTAIDAMLAGNALEPDPENDADGSEP
jgi:GNAT superfamily N-acetyltransferase